jgi:hypothetical protein
MTDYDAPMSPSSPSSNESTPVVLEGGLPAALGRYGHGLKTGVTSIAFWTAVILPFLHLPLLVSGLENSSTQLAFVGLLALNVVAAVLGQPHRSE